jgi:hypothetical protein
MLAAGS